MSDAAVAQQTDAALRVIKEGAVPSNTGVFQAMEGLAPENAPETPAPQVVQLVDAPGAEIDRELLEIFLEEAGEVVTTIAASLATSRGAPHDRESLTTIRRGFHTLKGSGRMVGLIDLGEMAWQCEQVMNKWLKDEKPASASLFGFIELARGSFEVWVGELKAGGVARIESAEIMRQAELIKSGQEVTAAVAVEPAPETPAAAIEVVELADVPEAPVAEVPAMEPAGDEPAHRAPAEFTFESLDLGAPATEPLPIGEAPLEPAEPQEPAEEAEITIGHIALAPAFFAIYVGEAEQHMEVLDREMSEIEADPLRQVTADFMRAAHTLTSCSRTTGFDALAEVAYALEKWLQEAMDFPPEFDERRLAVTRNGVNALNAMVQSVRGHALPYPRGDVIAELTALREGLRETRKTGHGTYSSTPGVAREPIELDEMAPEAPAEEPVAESAPEPIVEPVIEAPEHVAEAIPEPVAEAIPEPAEAIPEPVAEAIPEPVVEAIPEPIAAVIPAVESVPAQPTPELVVEKAAVEPQAEAPAGPFAAGKEQPRAKDALDPDLLPTFSAQAKAMDPLV